VGTDAVLWRFDDARFAAELVRPVDRWWASGDFFFREPWLHALRAEASVRNPSGVALIRDCVHLDGHLRLRVVAPVGHGGPEVCREGGCPSRARCPLHLDDEGAQRASMHWLFANWLTAFASGPSVVRRMLRVVGPWLDGAGVAPDHPTRRLLTRLFWGGAGITVQAYVHGWLTTDEVRSLADGLDALPGLPQLAGRPWTARWLHALLPLRLDDLLPLGALVMCGVRAASRDAREVGCGLLATGADTVGEDTEPAHRRHPPRRGDRRPGRWRRQLFPRTEVEPARVAARAGAVLDLAIALAPLHDDRVEFARAWVDRAARGARDDDAREKLAEDLAAAERSAVRHAVVSGGGEEGVAAWCQAWASRAALSLLGPEGGEHAARELLDAGTLALQVDGETDEAAVARLSAAVEAAR
jgi:hypothetical protein